MAAAVKVARLAQAMVARTRELVSDDGQKVQIRIGLHSGPVVGAVVGFKMPHFCLWWVGGKARTRPPCVAAASAG